MLIALIGEVLVVALLTFVTGGIGVSTAEMLAIAFVAVVIGLSATARRNRAHASKDVAAAMKNE